MSMPFFRPRYTHQCAKPSATTLRKRITRGSNVCIVFHIVAIAYIFGVSVKSKFVVIDGADRSRNFIATAMPPPLLSDSDSDSDTAPQPSLRINEAYARRFEHNKTREELHRLEAKYGKDVLTQKNKEEDEDVGSSTSESEDEVGELITPKVDAAIWRTIAMIREGRPEVYDETWKGFTDEPVEVLQKEKKEKVSPEGGMTLITANVSERLSSPELTLFFWRCRGRTQNNDIRRRTNRTERSISRQSSEIRV
jgi:hypothetical protein